MPLPGEGYCSEKHAPALLSPSVSVFLSIEGWLTSVPFANQRTLIVCPFDGCVNVMKTQTESLAWKYDEGSTGLQLPWRWSAVTTCMSFAALAAEPRVATGVTGMPLRSTA